MNVWRAENPVFNPGSPVLEARVVVAIIATKKRAANTTIDTLVKGAGVVCGLCALQTSLLPSLMHRFSVRDQAV